jgi:tetratricopeptide (TPR) repeat protein
VPKPNGDKSILNYYVIALFNKANIYKDRHDFDSARVIFDEVNDICVTNKILQGIPRVLFSYGDIEFQTGHFDKAINYLNQSLFWCDSIGAIPLKQDILNGKINMYTEKGKYKEALLLKEEYDRIDDSLKSTETKAAIQKAEINNKEKIRLVEKLADEKKIAQEKQTQMRWYLVATLWLLRLSVLSIYF